VFAGNPSLKILRRPTTCSSLRAITVQSYVARLEALVMPDGALIVLRSAAKDAAMRSGYDLAVRVRRAPRARSGSATKIVQCAFYERHVGS